MDSGQVAVNIAGIRGRIATAAARAGREPSAVKLVAVTKTHPAQAILDVVAAGVEDIGENKVQEAAAKFAEIEAQGLASGIRRHLVGHLQTNKAKAAVASFDLIHSVDSLRLARELDRHASATGRPCHILLEANVSGETSKFGLLPEALAGEAAQYTALPNVRVEGLMTMAPFVDDAKVIRRVFRALRELHDEIASIVRTSGGYFGPELSMGMTNDFEIAVEEGSTLVRVGTAIFGSREPA